MLDGKFRSGGRTAGEKILIAVSGGGDSLALLHMLCNDMGPDNLHVGTVDHGLRPEAGTEAKQVARWCNEIGIPHRILTSTAKGTSSQSARSGRYELLIKYAQDIGATTIALGHTMDDQAETVLMRAQRITPDSNTRGMAGMAQWATHNGIHLWRPLLDTKRSALRAYLRNRDIKWIEDPSNENLASERIRARQFLATSVGKYPSAESIARLAGFSAATRTWLDTVTANTINQCVSIDQNSKVIFAPTSPLPVAVVTDCLSLLIHAVGDRPHRPARGKLEDVADAILSGKTTRKAVGRCLISVKSGSATLEREKRKHPLQLNGTSHDAKDPKREVDLDVAALEQFRSTHDEASYQAVKNLFSTRKNSSLRST